MDHTSPSDTVIRSARADDHASIAAVVVAAGLFTVDEIGEINSLLDAFSCGDASEDCWLVDDTGGGVTGVAYYAPERMTKGTWNLYLLAVRPRSQEQGRGAALVHHVEQDLTRRGARVLLVETSGVPDFAGPRAFYTRLGYHLEARVRDFYDHDDDKIIYWKTIAR